MKGKVEERMLFVDERKRENAATIQRVDEMGEVIE